MELPSSLQRAASTLRMAAVCAADTALARRQYRYGSLHILTPFPHPQHTPPPPQQTNLEPIEDGLAELQTQHIELRSQIVEQNTSIKRVEDQLELVREATDRNTLEQQELLEDLKGVGNKVNVYALVALALLLISAANVILYLHIQRVLP